MRKCVLKKIAILGVVCMINALFIRADYACGAMKQQWGGGVKFFQSNARNLRYNFKKSSALCKKLLYDKVNNTGLLDEDKEETLNEYGILDEEIKTMDKSMLNGLSQGEIVCVNNMYYEEDDESQLKEMSQDAIDNTISEKYAKDISKVDTDSVLDKVYKLWNQKVSARMINSDSSTSACNSGKLQQTVIVYTTAVKNKLQVYYMARWIDPPHSRGTDFCGVWIQKGTVDVNSVSTEYVCHYQVYNKSMGRNYCAKDVTNNGAPVIARKEGKGVIVKKKLYTNWSELKVYNYKPFQLKWVNEYIKIQYDVYLSSGDFQYNNVVGDYCHKTDSTQVNASVGFSSSGAISISFSGNSQSNYTHIAPNVSTTFYYSSSGK